MTKLEKLCEIEGMTEEQMIEEYALDAVNPGICMNKDCNYTCDVEPDSETGWCDECQTNTVKSLCMLLGII